MYAILYIYYDLHKFMSHHPTSAVYLQGLLNNTHDNITKYGAPYSAHTVYLPHLYLNLAVIDEYLQNRDFLSAGIQGRQIIQVGVNGSISPVLKFPGEMPSLLIFYLSPDDVLEHLWRKTFGLLCHFLPCFPNASP